MITKKKLSQKGFSIIEMLVALFVFAILATVATQALTLTLTGSKKSESSLQARENAQFAINVIERQLRNARSITCTAPGVASNTLSYVDEHGAPSSFSCVTSGTDTYIASGSARLTSNKVRISNCNAVFTCSTSTTIPDSVDVIISAADAAVTGSEAGSASLSTKILLRNY